MKVLGLDPRVAALAAVLAAVLVRQWSGSGYRGPIIDNHVHVLPAALKVRRAYVDGLIAAMDRGGVAAVVLGLNAKPPRSLGLGPACDPAHDLWTLEAFARYPRRIYPSLGGFDPALAGAAAYVAGRLETGPWREIGELDLRNSYKRRAIPADSPAMMKIYRLAAARRLPVSIHYDYAYGTTYEAGRDELARAVAANPDVTFITAHHFDEELMKAHRNLWGEYQYYPADSGRLRELFERDPALIERIVVGTDVQTLDLRYNVRRWDDDASGRGFAPELSYNDNIAGLRKELGRLPPEAAEKVAYRNLLRILEPANAVERR